MGAPIREVDGFKVVVITGVVKRVNDKLVIVSRDNQGIMTALAYYPRDEPLRPRLGARLSVYDPTSKMIYDVWVYKRGREWLILAPGRFMPKEEGSVVHLYILV